MTGSPGSLHDNRDLDSFVAALVAEREKHARSLEEYLRALRAAGAAHREAEVLSLSCFAGLLEAALRAEAPPFDPAWLTMDQGAQADASGYARWERAIRAQIVDLHEMEQAGLLANEMRYFGIDAPRGARWYNFDPFTFLECGVAGTFGGWEPGDATGRDYVPGPVAVLDEQGHVTAVDPRTLADPIEELATITWDTFIDFLESGQSYE
jgi:hypothetical protein